MHRDVRIVQPAVYVTPVDTEGWLKTIERAGRLCYRSGHRMTADSCQGFVKGLVLRGHESVLEHVSWSVVFMCDRAIANQIVRHRIGAYSQVSSRFDLTAERLGGEIAVVEPFYLQPGTPAYATWYEACSATEVLYRELLAYGCTPEQARTALPLSLCTYLMVTYNLRQWRHFLRLRTARAAHPQMRQLAIPLYLYLKEHVPVLFTGIGYDSSFPAEHYARIIELDEETWGELIGVPQNPLSGEEV